MKRIAIIGSSCAGKSTLARDLSARLGYRHIELDALHWLPNWEARDAEPFRDLVKAATQDEGWVTDGNYNGKLGTLVFDQADTIVWLNLPFLTIYGRMWRRIFQRIRDREALWNGNRETLANTFLGKDSLIYFIPRTFWDRNRRFRKWFESAPAGKTMVELRSSDEVSAWLATCSN